jgi:hypothetical protein
MIGITFTKGGRKGNKHPAEAKCTLSTARCNSVLGYNMYQGIREFRKLSTAPAGGQRSRPAKTGGVVRQQGYGMEASTSYVITGLSVAHASLAEEWLPLWTYPHPGGCRS